MEKNKRDDDDDNPFTSLVLLLQKYINIFDIEIYIPTLEDAAYHDRYLKKVSINQKEFLHIRAIDDLLEYYQNSLDYMISKYSKEEIQQLLGYESDVNLEILREQFLEMLRTINYDCLSFNDKKYN